MKGKIEGVFREDMSFTCLYRCLGDDGPFSFSVEFRYHMGILDCEGKLIGREIEYDGGIEPPGITFLD
jgi:hypothetical protein